MVDLGSHIGRENLARKISADVDAACETMFAEEPRTHLGASQIGDECWRKSWNVFRWLKQEKFNGQELRLFNRGHLEEARFVEYLRAAGFDITEVDPETGKQFRMSASGGHYGGSFDGIGYLPVSYGYTLPLIVEFKTHNEKSFAKLAGSIVSRTPEYVRKNPGGVKKTKPVHFRQMSQYGYSRGIRYGLYCAVNKDTDELWFEIVELDWNDAANQLAKADQIILSQEPPPKIAESPAFFDCKYCHFAGICHAQQLPDKNCRSCRVARPIDGKQWYCNLHQSVIPDHIIKTGCDSWGSIV